MANKDYDIVALHNIDSEDFTFEYDRSQGNPPYTIPAGQIKRFPRFLAAHALKHLIDKLITKTQKKTNNETLRAELRSQIVVDEETFQEGPIKTQADELKEKVDSMNKSSDLEKILEKKKAEEKISPVKTMDNNNVDETPKQEEKFEGLEGDEVDTTDEAPVEPETKPVPTRREIYQYAQKQGLKMTPEFVKKFDKMKIEELLQEIGDPRESLA